MAAIQAVTASPGAGPTQMPVASMSTTSRLSMVSAAAMARAVDGCPVIIDPVRPRLSLTSSRTRWFRSAKDAAGKRPVRLLSGRSRCDTRPSASSVTPCQALVTVAVDDVLQPVLVVQLAPPVSL